MAIDAGPLSSTTLSTPVNRVLVLGRPGSGKGTQGRRLAGILDVPHISMGEVLRAEIECGSLIGRGVATHVAAGRLVPDALVESALAGRLADACATGFVLDGYPRTISQGITLERLLAPEPRLLALELVVPEHEAAHRLQLRRRGDDDESVIRRRFEEYQRSTKPLLDWLDRRRLLVTVDADRPPAEVTDALLAVLTSVEAGVGPALSRGRRRPRGGR